VIPEAKLHIDHDTGGHVERTMPAGEQELPEKAYFRFAVYRGIRTGAIRVRQMINNLWPS
jgi:hypothetical protein